MPVVRIGEDGRLDIPEEVRLALGLHPGALVSVSLTGDRFTVAPAEGEAPGMPAYAAARKSLETPLRFLKGVGPRLCELLAKKGLETVEQLLYLLPARYEDRREIRRIRELRPGSRETFVGEVVSISFPQTKGGKRLVEAVVGDGSGTIVFKWFHGNPRYMKETWKPGRRGIFSGEVSRFGLLAEIHHPEAEWLRDGEDAEAVLRQDALSFGRILPVYPLTEGLSQKVMRKLTWQAVESFAAAVPDLLPAGLRKGRGLLPLGEALRSSHYPPAEADPAELASARSDAHRTLAYDEFFFLELGLALRKRGSTIESGISFSVTHRYTKELLKLLPYSLTGAQRRVLSEIKEDMMAPHPMHRLVQGDVGSGKTLVALMAALVAVENGYQVAIMAPTEILAEQHFLNIHGWCDQLGVSVVLLTSSLKGKAKAAVLARVAAGEAQIVIGTHAVIQEEVEFARLGLGIVDEQHRFGVVQRGILRRKGENPDILVMTATPIPRTLAMTVFGDLSLSLIDEMPPGRTPVETRVYYDSQRDRAYRVIAEEAAAGRQAYIVYPLVEESEKSELKAAAQMAEHLQTDIFPRLRVGLLHGRMKPEEKESVMRSFKGRELDILVATTVIEVGIDVPNASVMMIEHAERFGLSQLHQLRGRVGRGAARSRCLLVAGRQLSEEGRRRLQVMTETTDGFRISEADLEIRGPGDFLGTRQSGMPDLRVASVLRDAAVLEAARADAFELLEKEPDLLEKEPLLQEELVRRWGGRLELASVA
ncbi:MAG TPA: ATP-dependent DNA helicase RecG [Verrucomicrobiae bacterium]|nr:ATP-dependent DNA helicase RecG [Verrucomicrobiae bacterium]